MYHVSMDFHQTLDPIYVETRSHFLHAFIQPISRIDLNSAYDQVWTERTQNYSLQFWGPIATCHISTALHRARIIACHISIDFLDFVLYPTGTRGADLCRGQSLRDTSASISMTLLWAVNQRGTRKKEE